MCMKAFGTVDAWMGVEEEEYGIASALFNISSNLQ